MGDGVVLFVSKSGGEHDVDDVEHVGDDEVIDGGDTDAASTNSTFSSLLLMHPFVCIYVTGKD